MKLALLRAPQPRGMIAIEARVIVASDADSSTRMQAPQLWVKEEPVVALPHLKLFFHSPNRDYAISILADCAAMQSVPEFETALENPSNSFAKFDAWRGLLRAGKQDPLKETRGLVDGEATRANEKAKKTHAIYLLGDFGFDEDVVRLEKLLDTEFAVFAAKTLLRRFFFEKSESE